LRKDLGLSHFTFREKRGKMAGMKRFFLGVFLLLFAGCQPSYDSSEVKRIFLNGYKEELATQQESANIPADKRITVVDVALTDETPRKWTGYVELSDGRKVDVEITIGSNDKMIWKTR
jgi:hypothetical protein